MKARIITALLLMPLLIWGIVSGGVFLSMIIALITALGSREFMTIMHNVDMMQVFKGTFTGKYLTAISVLFSLYIVFVEKPEYLLVSLSALMLVSLVATITQGPLIVAGVTAAMTFSVIYVAIPMRFMLMISGMNNGTDLILLMLVTVWASDSAAYFFGIRYGRHRLCEPLSPKKSWEGAAAGMIGALLTAFVAGHYYLGISPLMYIFTGLATGILAPLGDLLESAIKRYAHIKDSSRLFPGHGGMLDRIDSFTFMLPAIWLAAYTSTGTGF